MKIQPNTLNKQAGVMLLEALISILIFSIGILAIVALQAVSIKSAGDAKYRTDASLLANKLIADMWTSNRTQAVLQANFQSPAGPGYLNWVNNNVNRSLPGVAGVAANLPVVTIVPVNATATPSSMVTITLFWNAPSEAPQAHQFITVAQII